MALNVKEYQTMLGKSYNDFTKLVDFIKEKYIMDELINGNEIKFRRSGKTLVTFYLKEGSFSTLIIFGKVEREKFESAKDTFSDYICDYYDNSKTYHDGKWMFIEIGDEKYLPDIYRMIMIKKNPNRK